ncbi:membrane protein insertase YidC [Deinococcus sp.]|uniref:YidC/Oxa1 family membrane protein insertase n=1 Tax=Deinococcus sp. TaxID=47478 RepID=UPI0025D7DB46|nr:membrane protein insertase YidC [Deinococcus sp.]
MTKPPRPGARKWILGSTLGLLALLLSGCGVGQPGQFGHVLQAGWIQADFDGDKKPDLIAQTNLADIAFNSQGEIIGWYVKVNPGSQLVKQGQGGSYNFDGLKGSLVTNLLGVKNGPDNKPLLVSGRKGLEVVLGGADASATRQVQPPTTKTELGQNRLSAVFIYTQGGATVTKTVVVHPRQFTIQADVNVAGAATYKLNFAGLAREGDPAIKALPSGAATPVLNAGTTEKVSYAAIQSPAAGLFHNSQTSAALLIRPQQGGQGGAGAGASITNAAAAQTPAAQTPAAQTPFSVTTLGGANASLSVNATGPLALDIYGGKNELIHLYQGGYTELPGVFAPNIFGYISLYIAKFMAWLYSFLGNWGLTILVLTVVLRLVIWPLMQAQGRTTAKMQMVQPLQKELQARYKDDPAKLQAETMRLYREYEVNPVGCLSMFIPLPILVVLYGTIRNFEFDQGLGWLPDLSIPDPFWILGVLYVAANILQLYVSTRKAPQMFRQQAVMYLFFAYFALTFPAGVTLYWIIGTLIGTGQQYLINKQVETQMSTGLQKVEKKLATGGAGAAGGKVNMTKGTTAKVGTAKVSMAKTVTVEPSGKPSKAAAPVKPGFRAVLEAAAKQAAEQQRLQQDKKKS